MADAGKWGDEADRDRLQPPSVQPDYFRPARPGFVQLIAWIIITTLLWNFSPQLYLGTDLSAHRHYFFALPSPPNLSSPWLISFLGFVKLLIMCILMSSATVGATAILRSRFAANRLLLQPGHWIILIEVATFSLVGAMTILMFKRTFGPGLSPNPVYLMTAAAYFWRSWYLRYDVQWRWLFRVLAAVAVLKGIFNLLWIAVVPWLAGLAMTGPTTTGRFFAAILSGLDVLPNWLDIIVSVPVLFAAIWDYRANRVRDWLHWLGVVLAGKGLVLTVACRIVYWFVRWLT